jgi:hypothetical protein
MLRRLVISVLLLWLPLQAVAAVTMPFCRHTFDSGMTASQEPALAAQHAHHQHEPGAPSGSPSSAADQHGGLTCNDCGSCHLACAPAVLSQLTSGQIVPLYTGLDLPPFLTPPAFVLDRPKPPPLLRG